MAEIPIQRKEGRNIWPILIGLLILLGILWYLFGRNRNNNTVATTDSTTTATTTTSNGMAGGDSASMAGGASGAAAGGMTNGMNGNSPVPASAKQMTDPEIFAMISAVNQGEIDAGKIAQSKATNASVKSYANDMVKAHTALITQNGKLAAALGSIPQPDAKDSIVTGNMAAAAKLKAASGAAFDSAYIQSQVTAHSRALAFLQQAQNQAQNADLKKMITAAIPDVQQHLERARSLSTQR